MRKSSTRSQILQLQGWVPLLAGVLHPPYDVLNRIVLSEKWNTISVGVVLHSNWCFSWTQHWKSHCVRHISYQYIFTLCLKSLCSVFFGSKFLKDAIRKVNLLFALTSTRHIGALCIGLSGPVECKADHFTIFDVSYHQKDVLNRIIFDIIHHHSITRFYLSTKISILFLCLCWLFTLFLSRHRAAELSGRYCYFHLYYDNWTLANWVICYQLSNRSLKHSL